MAWWDWPNLDGTRFATLPRRTCRHSLSLDHTIRNRITIRRLLGIIGIASSFVLLGLQVTSCNAPDLAATATPSINSLEFEDLTGKIVRLSDYRGKVVVLNFWATWCPPCLMELPHFKEAYGEFQDRNVAFLGASLDAMEPYNMNPEAIGAFAAKRELGYPIVTADREALQLMGRLQEIRTVFQGMEDSPVREDGSISSIPTTFFIDTKGKIHHKYVGYMPKAYLVKQLNLLLNAF